MNFELKIYLIHFSAIKLILGVTLARINIFCEGKNIWWISCSSFRQLNLFCFMKSIYLYSSRPPYIPKCNEKFRNPSHFKEIPDVGSSRVFEVEHLLAACAQTILLSDGAAIRALDGDAP